VLGKHAGEVVRVRHPLYHSNGQMGRSSDVIVGSGKPSVRFMPQPLRPHTSSFSSHTTVVTRYSENQTSHDYNSNDRIYRSDDVPFPYGVSSNSSVDRFMPQFYSSVVTRCSEIQTAYDCNLKATCIGGLMPPLIRVTAGDAAARFSSEENEPLPLNLSLSANHKVAPETEPRRDSFLPQGEKSYVEIPRCRPTDETIATHKEKLIVRGKIYDIVPIGSGLWLLNGDSDF